jgi:GNAT superfamily N-acetyltransferase
MPAFREVKDAGNIETVAGLAHEIWNEHFVPIIGQPQVDYMLARFQSASAITGQINRGYFYYLIMSGEAPEGYFAIIPNPGEKSLQLSKLYVRKSMRGKGYGQASVRFVECLCRQMGIQTIWLTVNKRNLGSIAVYIRMGFANKGSLLMDIGNGFIMDDYRMEKTLIV